MILKDCMPVVAEIAKLLEAHSGRKVHLLGHPDGIRSLYDKLTLFKNRRVELVER